ncbi:MAG: ribosome silencing factor [Bacteroidales bacterium]|jgi:ribosome-associated protein|nr:ribosome silencing factor [Bacteroidales bacterium]
MQKAVSTKKLLSTIIEGIAEKKGEHTISLDFKNIENAICKYFVICEGNSTTHVTAIADGITDYVQKNTGVKVWQKSGYENAEWIILDYAEIMVHIFQPYVRNYYNIEELWADCPIKQYK